MNTLPISGRLAAAFFSTSVAAVVLGMLICLRDGVLKDMLTVYTPAAAFGGVWLYSYLIWIVLWTASHLALRRRESLGTLPAWTVIFVASVLTEILLGQITVEWHTLLG
jgi:hypothetical protein